MSMFLVYKRTIELGATKMGGKLEWSHGCNTEKHVDWLNEVFYSESGDVEFATTLAVIDRGLCDCSCNHHLSWFTYP